jgi:hypothetical protein
MMVRVSCGTSDCCSKDSRAKAELYSAVLAWHSLEVGLRWGARRAGVSLQGGNWRLRTDSAKVDWLDFPENRRSVSPVAIRDDSLYEEMTCRCASAVLAAQASAGTLFSARDDRW